MKKKYYWGVIALAAAVVGIAAIATSVGTDPETPSVAKTSVAANETTETENHIELTQNTEVPETAKAQEDVTKEAETVAVAVAIAEAEISDDAAHVSETEPSDSSSLSECARTMYTATQRPELDEAVYKAFEAYETHKDMDSNLIVYRGTYEECVIFRDYFNTNYGYTYDIRTNAGKTNTGYCVLFPNTLNADEKISAYLAEVQKAETIAASLNAGSTDETIQNVINWVKEHVEYYYEEDTDEGYLQHYYGAYSGNEVLCEGYAMTVYQLCAMNGIKASIEEVISNRGVNHAMNTVTFSSGVKFVDTTRINPVTDQLPEGFTYQPIQ